MRLHEHFPQLWPAYDEVFVRRMLRVDNLVAVRLEPVYSIRFEAFMDALFEAEGAWLIVPMLRVDGVSIMVPENPPVTWPTTYREYAGEEIDRIDGEILPWLRSVTSARLVNDEHVRFFREDTRLIDAYERARSEGLMGATPYPQVLRSVAGAVYATRFAVAGPVALRGNDAANGAAVLSAVTRSIDVEANEFARKWFTGINLNVIDASRKYGCYVGPRDRAISAEYSVFDGDARDGERTIALAEPIPTDVTLSFDLEDGPESRRYAVREVVLDLHRSSIAEPAAAGGSGGCIRLVVRDDARRFLDADVDAAEALAKRLRAEGFDAAVTTAAHVDVDQADIIHIFDLRHNVSIVELLRDAETAAVPIVVTPHADDRRNEAVSGSSGSLLIPRVSSDTVTFYDFVSAFAARKIANLSEGHWYDEASEIILKRASVAMVTSEAEAQFLRERFAYAGRVIPSAAVVPIEPPCDAIGSLVGPDEYILVHAPIETRNNCVYAALAAQRLGLPLVILGPVADVEFYRYLNEVAGPRTIQLREELLTPGEIAALYARARVVADVSWSSRGLHRLARGAAHGAAIVASGFGYAREVWGEHAVLADPASLDSITQAFDAAWKISPDQRPRLAAVSAAVCDPTASLIAAVSAYQQASPAAPVA